MAREDLVGVAEEAAKVKARMEMDDQPREEDMLVLKEKNIRYFQLSLAAHSAIKV